MSQYGPGDPRQPLRAKKRNQWVHLLWAEPLALPFAAAAWMLGAISRCGVSGCSGGGFGVSRDSVTSAVGFTASALILAFPIAMVPWARRRIRISVAAGIAALWFSYWWIGSGTR